MGRKAEDCRVQHVTKYDGGCVILFNKQNHKLKQNIRVLNAVIKHFGRGAMKVLYLTVYLIVIVMWDGSKS